MPIVIFQIVLIVYVSLCIQLPPIFIPLFLSVRFHSLAISLLHLPSDSNSMDRLELPMVFPFPEQHLSLQLQAFWENQKTDIENLEEIKNHSLPLARIKKIMKSDEEVRMIAGEVPVLFSRACEMFILEMTMRAWSNTERHKRRTLQKCDVAAAVAQTDIFDFLVDIVPRDDVKEEEAPAAPPASYCFLPGQPGVTLVDNGWEVEGSGSKSDGE